MALAFVQSVELKPYGVLGQQMKKDKSFVQHVPEPCDCDDAFVDPAGLHHMQPPGGPSGAGGAAGAIYKSIGIDTHAAFPSDVVAAVKKTCDAKYHLYKKRGKDVHVVHAVGPDFRKDPSPGKPYTRMQAIDELAVTYKNIFSEFLACGQDTLRLLPVSGGIFGGAFLTDIAPLTHESLQACYKLLSSVELRDLEGKDLHMCIFEEEELPQFQRAGFVTTGATMSEKIDIEDNEESQKAASNIQAAFRGKKDTATTAVTHGKNPKYVDRLIAVLIAFVCHSTSQTFSDIL